MALRHRLGQVRNSPVSLSSSFYPVSIFLFFSPSSPHSLDITKLTNFQVTFPKFLFVQFCI